LRPPGGGAPQGPDPKSAEYGAKRDAAQKLLDGVKVHAQQAHVSAEIGTATGQLASAKGHADKSEWPQALADVEEARKTCVAATGFADRFGAYLAKRADTTALLNAATAAGLNMAANLAKANAADTKAARACPTTSTRA